MFNTDHINNLICVDILYRYLVYVFKTENHCQTDDSGFKD